MAFVQGAYDDIQAWVHANNIKDPLDLLVLEPHLGHGEDGSQTPEPADSRYLFFDSEEDVEEEEKEDDSGAAFHEATIFIDDDIPQNALGPFRTYPTTSLIVAHYPAHQLNELLDAPSPSRIRSTTHLVVAHHCPAYQQEVFRENSSMANPLTASRPLAVCHHGHEGAQDSPSTDDCPSATAYPIPESLSPSTTTVSVPILQASISPYSTTIPPSASSQIAGSVALSPATLIPRFVTWSPTILITGSVTPSPSTMITESVTPSLAPLIAGSGQLSSTIPIDRFVALSPTTQISGSVVLAPPIPIAVWDTPGPTTSVIALCAMTTFQVATSILPSPLVTDAATILRAQITFPPHHPTLASPILTTLAS
ncbi:hypothetical protein HOY80DRAFT_1047510 [Tuber brumale]|nr:hypothetical protein HOY80DRAFT_1047510 [Tuber brumale]